MTLLIPVGNLIHHSSKNVLVQDQRTYNTIRYKSIELKQKYKNTRSIGSCKMVTVNTDIVKRVHSLVQVGGIW